MNDPRRLRDAPDATPVERELLDALEAPPPPPGAKARVAAALLERINADVDDADAAPDNVRRIG